jgi:two-component system heavy metal sensor histidine kinase CusS
MKNSLERSLSWQMAMQTAVTLLAVCTLIWLGIAWLFEHQHAQRWQAKADGVVETMRDALFDGQDHVLAQLKAQAATRPGSFVVIRRADGRDFYRDPERTFAMVDSGPDLGFTMEAPQHLGGPFHASLSLDRGEDADMLTKLAVLLASTALLGGAFAGWTALLRIRRGLLPIRDLAAQADAIDASRLGQRLRLSNPVDELQATVRQFNALMERLEQAHQQLDAYNADLAHELRTLLAALIGPAELALSRDRSPEVLREILASSVEGLKELAGTINDMLFLARAAHGALPRRGEPQSVADIGQAVLDFHDAALEEAELGRIIEGDAVAAVDVPLIKRALSNLVSNATRYAQRGSTLRLVISAADGDQVRLMVENRGPAIDSTVLPRIFERFVRADSTRLAADGSNHGLGLAIVAAVARMHGGSPTAECADGLTQIGFSIRRHD